MDKFEIKAKIEKEFEDLSENFVINLAVDQLVYNKAHIVMLEHLMQKLKLKGLIICLTKLVGRILLLPIMPRQFSLSCWLGQCKHA